MDNARLVAYCIKLHNQIDTELSLDIIDYFYEYIFREELYYKVTHFSKGATDEPDLMATNTIET